MEKPARPLGAERGGACGVWGSRQRRHIHADTGSVERKERQTVGDDPQLRDYFFFARFGELGQEGALCVCQLRGSACERGDVCVGAAGPECCLECVGVCGLACLGWKSGTGTTNSSALSFTPWGAATVTPRLRRQTGKLFRLLRSAVRNCKF